MTGVQTFVGGGRCENFSVELPAGVFHTVATGVDFASIGFAADSIVKEDGPTRYDSLVHLRGDVEIRTCCVGSPKRPRVYMIMRADEADYDGEKGEIEARGSVRVSFQKPN